MTAVRRASRHVQLTADPTGFGLQVDVQGRPIDANGAAIEGIHYLGPWLRARDWEATAVGELRRIATALVGTLLDAAMPSSHSCRIVAQAHEPRHDDLLCGRARRWRQTTGA